MSQADPITISWKRRINHLLVEHERHLGEFTEISRGVDRHGGIEWSWFKNEGDLDRYLLLDVLPKGPEDSDQLARVELWIEAGNKALYTRKMLFSRPVFSGDVESALKGEFEITITALLSINDADLDTAVGRPLWSSAEPSVESSAT
ncbi:hypothetical protein ACIQ7Q_34645 [Streptomyces sp. NPDC096176]|uniref:hypothetical protein n=1 Tax=Streptomyces sp. NPDC096176 TaxID=3366079 RepID=UPI00381D2E01